MRTKTISLESPESSSPIITRAVAAGLRGEYCDTYIFPAWQRHVLSDLGLFPQGAARFVISRFEAYSGLEPGFLANQAAGTFSESLAQERLKDYDLSNGPYPCVTIGAGLGGASAHLSLAMGGPFLPQAFVATLRQGAPDGDVNTYFQRSVGLAKKIAQENPGLMIIQHYDPIHDEWMTRYVNHLRFKLLHMPQAYKDFLHRNLEPGGAVCYLNCQAQWLRYRLGERNLFQVGGWGDISAQEFLEGSERIERYCQSVGLNKHNWRLPEYPLEKGPESEWGSEPGLGEELKDFCRRDGYRFISIRFSEPHDYSRLAFQAVTHLLNSEGRQPAGVIIEMFSQFDATAVIQSGLLPLWLVFNTWDSLAFLKAMRTSFPDDKPVFFSPLATFTPTPDIVPWHEWEAALLGMDWHNIGTRSSHYPADARTLVHWAEPLRKWVTRHFQPIQARLTPEELEKITLDPHVS